MEISIKDLIDIIRKKLWILIVCVVASTVAFGAAAQYIITPMYDSSSKFIVIYTTATVSESVDGSTTTTYSQDLVSDTSVLTNTISILDTADFYQVAADYFTYANLTLEDLQESVTLSQSSSILTLNVSYSDPQIAYQLARSISELIEPYLSENYPQPGSNVIGINKIESEQLALLPSSPNVLMYLIIGFLAGGVLGVLIILILKFTDVRIHKESDLTQYKLAVLGVVPVFKDEEE